MPKSIKYTVAAIAALLMAGFAVYSLSSPGGDFADETNSEIEKLKRELGD